MKSGIYRIDLGNDYFYYGSAKNLDKRAAAHLNDLKARRHKNNIMQRNWDKYGVFDFVVLSTCPESQQLVMEQTLLDKYVGQPKCANILCVAGNMSGYKHTEASRKKNSDAHKGVRLSDETRKKMSDHQKTSPVAKAHLASITALNVGRPRSEASRKKSSVAITNSPAHKAWRESKEGSARDSAGRFQAFGKTGA